MCEFERIERADHQRNPVAERVSLARSTGTLRGFDSRRLHFFGIAETETVGVTMR
jgi:hypothetical protein